MLPDNGLRPRMPPSRRQSSPRADTSETAHAARPSDLGLHGSSRLFSARFRLMNRSSVSRVSWLAMLLVGLLVVDAMSQNPSPATTRARSQKLMNDGNFREAYDGFRRLCLDPNAGAAQVGRDLEQAVQCLSRLGRILEFDDLVEKTVSAHGQNWRLLQTAAQQYVSVDHQGFKI